MYNAESLTQAILDIAGSRFNGDVREAVESTLWAEEPYSALVIALSSAYETRLVLPADMQEAALQLAAAEDLDEFQEFLAA